LHEGLVLVAAAALFMAQRILRSKSCRDKEPAGQAAIAAHRRSLACQRQKHYLTDIFGQIGIADFTATGGEHHVKVPLNYLIECRL
jgi:hypothetical protein